MSNRRARGGHKGGGRRYENNRIYANPLPVLFENPVPTRLASVCTALGISFTKVVNPHCEGIFDPLTKSVWITNQTDSMIMWRRGFFGKGDLSRSEPSWLARQKKELRKGNKTTSEEVREKRRAERKQFKIDRAKAIAEAAADAEAIYAAEGRVVVPAVSGPSIPSAATWKPAAKEAEKDAQTLSSPASMAPQPAEELDEEAIEELDDIEHLQLTLPEAFFLIWTLDCLTILDTNTNEPMSLQQIWTTFQTIHLSPQLPTLKLFFDNPFLIHYVAYHHFRSLGWVVRGGIKFCVDYLLYKRGPVFTHAEFAVVICPVYEDESDQEESQMHLQNASPFSWSWLSTINRVNTQVQKTLILAYVTIPARSRVPMNVLTSPACLSHYSVREIVVRRFIPARMRD